MHPGSPEGTTIPLRRLHPGVTAPVTWSFPQQDERRKKDGRPCCFDGLITLTDVTGAKRKTADIPCSLD
jgi:hypothetical protein